MLALCPTCHKIFDECGLNDRIIFMIGLLKNCDGETKRKILNKKDELMKQRGYPASVFEIEPQKGSQTNVKSDNNNKNRKRKSNKNNNKNCWDRVVLVMPSHCQVQRVKNKSKQ